MPVREPVTFCGEFYRLRKFRLGAGLPGRRPEIIVGALGAGMLRLAGALADGVLLNYCWRLRSQVPLPR